MPNAASFAGARPPPAPAREPSHLTLIGERGGSARLPAQPAPLIGRAQELAAARRCLAAGDTRLLTFTGPGGAGKTRLAVEVAARLRDAFDEDAIFVDLAPVPEPSLVGAAIAHAVGIRETANEPLEERLKRALLGRRLLLLLDNFEHITAAAPLAARLLAACPQLSILATSRVPLNLRWEQVFVVPPLALPDIARLPVLDALAAVPAVALFVNRARAVKPDFALDDHNAGAVAELCVRLDGLPLAIQLAASRSRMFPPPAMLERLRRGLDLLSDGARDLPARQQTLRAAMAWSYDLLAPSEQTGFRRLGVFAGGCTVAAAEAIIPDPAAPLDVVDGMEALLAHSLLRQDDVPGDEPRCTMLDTIREYALEQLVAAGEAVPTRARHAAYYLALAEQAEPDSSRPREAAWLDRIARDHDNLRCALQWLVDQDDTPCALRLAGALWPFWHVRGRWTEGRERLATVLAMPEGQPHPHYRAEALFGAATLARSQGDYAAARSLYAQSLDLWRAFEDRQGIARALSAMGDVAQQQGDRETARSLFEDSLAVARAAGDREQAAAALNFLGIAASERGDYPEARRLLEEGLALRRELDDRRGIANSLLNLGTVLRHEGDLAGARTRVEESVRLFRELDSKLGLSNAATTLGNLANSEGDYLSAQSHYQESLAIQRGLGDRAGMARSLASLGAVALARGDPAAAGSLYAQSLALRRVLQDRAGTAISLEGLAGVAAALSQPERALRLGGAAAAQRTAAGVILSPDEQSTLESRLSAARHAVGERAAAIWTEGQAMSEAAAYTLAAEPPPAPTLIPTPPQPPPLPIPRRAPTAAVPTPTLTAREREVALLVAQGCTNRQIAEKLVVTPGTAALHVEHIRRKLRFHARSQIATWVATQNWNP